MNWWRFIAAVPLAWVLGSCTSETRDPSRPAPAPKSLSQRLNEKNGYKQDDQGNWVPQSDKRSSFERVGESPYFHGERKEKEYRTGDYKASSWWGKKDYRKSEWQPKEDGKRFQTTARQQSQRAREAGKTSDMSQTYRTDDFATGSAREAGTRGIERVQDAETELQRGSYKAPEVLDWNEQRRLSREETKSLLGR